MTVRYRLPFAARGRFFALRATTHWRGTYLLLGRTPAQLNRVLAAHLEMLGDKIPVVEALVVDFCAVPADVRDALDAAELAERREELLVRLGFAAGDHGLPSGWKACPGDENFVADAESNHAWCRTCRGLGAVGVDLDAFFALPSAAALIEAARPNGAEPPGDPTHAIFHHGGHHAPGVVLTEIDALRDPWLDRAKPVAFAVVYPTELHEGVAPQLAEHEAAIARAAADKATRLQREADARAAAEAERSAADHALLLRLAAELRSRT